MRTANQPAVTGVALCLKKFRDPWSTWCHSRTLESLMSGEFLINVKTVMPNEDPIVFGCNALSLGLVVSNSNAGRIISYPD
jgi:hypothetical protein